MSKGNFKSRTPWADKMKKPAHCVVEVLTEDKSKAYPAGRMLIPTPVAVDEIVQKIPKGELLTTDRLRKILAAQNNADYTCPMTTGIFLRIAAEYAEEKRLSGDKNVTPYWRVVRDDGSLIDKLPGGIEHQAALLTNEGFTFIAKGKSNLRVKGFEEYVASL